MRQVVRIPLLGALLQISGIVVLFLLQSRLPEWLAILGYALIIIGSTTWTAFRLHGRELFGATLTSLPFLVYFYVVTYRYITTPGLEHLLIGLVSLGLSLIGGGLALWRNEAHTKTVPPSGTVL